MNLVRQEREMKGEISIRFLIDWITLHSIEIKQFQRTISQNSRLTVYVDPEIEIDSWIGEMNMLLKIIFELCRKSINEEIILVSIHSIVFSNANR